MTRALNQLVFVIFMATLLAGRALPQDAGARSTSAPDPVLDGTRWSMTLERQEGGDADLPHRHVLVFEKSKATLCQMPHLGFAAAKPTETSTEGKTEFKVTFTEEDEGTIVVTGVVAGSGKGATLSGSARWTRDDETTEFKMTGKPAGALEGTTWTLEVKPRPLPDDEDADEPFEESITFFDGKLWLSSDTLNESAPAPYALNTADGVHEVKATLKDDADTMTVTCRIKAKTLAGTLVWRDEDSILLDSTIKGSPIR